MLIRLNLRSFEPANRQTTPDFLVAVTDPAARIPRAGYTNQPRTADDFAKYFKQSKIGTQNSAEVTQYMEEYGADSGRALEFAMSARAEFAKRSGKNKYVFLIISE